MLGSTPLEEPWAQSLQAGVMGGSGLVGSSAQAGKTLEPGDHRGQHPHALGFLPSSCAESAVTHRRGREMQKVQPLGLLHVDTKAQRQPDWPGAGGKGSEAWRLLRSEHVTVLCACYLLGPASTGVHHCCTLLQTRLRGSGGHHHVRLGLVPAGKGGRWGPPPPLSLLSAADPSPPGPSTVEERVAQEALETLQLEKRLSLLSHAGRPGSGGGAGGWPGLWDFS